MQYYNITSSAATKESKTVLNAMNNSSENYKEQKLLQSASGQLPVSVIIFRFLHSIGNIPWISRIFSYSCCLRYYRELFWNRWIKVSSSKFSSTFIYTAKNTRKSDLLLDSVILSDTLGLTFVKSNLCVWVVYILIFLSLIWFCKLSND
jgi:hypothetical protein